ncbi:MAG: oligoendopeptidase F [Acholeplasmataceae bacterium]
MSKWDLSPFYPNIEAWEEDIKKLPKMIDEIADFKGKLSDFASFKLFHEKDETLTKFIYRLYGYIHLSSDLNLKDQDKASKNQQMMIIFSEIGQKTSFVSPEFISIGEEKIMSFIDRDKTLEPYRFGFKKLFLQQSHVLSDDKEKLLSNFSSVRSIPSSLYQGLSIIDAVDETIILSDGSKKTITLSNYRSLITEVPTAEDRKKVFEAAFKRYKSNKSTFAATYNLVLQNLKANYKSRNFNSAVESALFRNNIPVEVYKNLMDASYESNASIKRYINLRKKHLKLDTYHTYDRFLTLVKDDTKFDFETSKDLWFKALEGMDEEFVKQQHTALQNGFVDVLPADGKRTGAYSSGLYGFHPYILLNHDFTLDSVFTMAHECGHSAHTLFSTSHQPMATSDYTIFVAEVASTFNEHVLLDYLVKNAKSKEQKIALLEKALDGFMSTFFRQTLFATYEYKANELVEKGMPITDQSLSNIMIDLYKHYYDLDITSENGKEYVWAYIPHLFHTPFYVYQYATSYSASLKIYEDVSNKVPGAMDKFKDLLKSGGSDYPVNQVAKAGADLTDKETFKAVTKRFDSLIDQLEKALEE